ncbi:hypothetical protein HZA97_02365 [Candidatus Woesearchaeota archaeon]|nr:hypothetical protein [Candidatus Woesearchaeota archaeon]
MDKNLLNLNVGDIVRINSETFTVRERSFHEKPNEWEPAITRYEFGNDYVLEFNDETPHFFRLITKKGWFGFTTTTSKNEVIKEIKIIKKKSIK